MSLWTLCGQFQAVKYNKVSNLIPNYVHIRYRFSCFKWVSFSRINNEKQIEYYGLTRKKVHSHLWSCRPIATKQKRRDLCSLLILASQRMTTTQKMTAKVWVPQCKLVLHNIALKSRSEQRQLCGRETWGWWRKSWVCSRMLYFIACQQVFTEILFQKFNILNFVKWESPYQLR